MCDRASLKHKKRIVIKVGSSSLVHEETGMMDLFKLEQLVRILCDLRNQGKEVILVSSGAIGAGRKVLGLNKRPSSLPVKQACASVGQGALIALYQRLFNEYHQISSQILMTKHTIIREKSLFNARNTFDQLLDMGVIPIVNENDTVSTDEIEFGDNDTLSAVVAALVSADLLILMSDIDGLYTDDPNKNPNARFIECVYKIDKSLYDMAKGAGSDFGTGGMVTKIDAARIATDSGCDMIISNGKDFRTIHDIIEGKNIGTLFLAHKNEDFDLKSYIEEGKRH
ncbi:glutamate 5-kinase [Frisingicoccus sp.]|uniref:glutamate 5-kinase n=1 Tax=Frisingicoccus sp. TaxID=1918627 RepID=UPI0025BE69E3|nr:glutamate 5-kinase [Frisingicoccus sp.]MDD6231724.1 glutamate 5-kinase [Frisingicoccus sp.]MDY4835668.1 glutamate 5-kinase [Frisingicoccus sp.]MDY4922848.1 glutamate 5-kinase [Frisingicoccus sp.]MDY5957678.1 glutamate 5-kinase [Frisingicoccus sp.]